MSNDSSSSNSSSFNNGDGQANVSTTLQQQNAGIDAGVWHQSLELFFICFCCFFIREIAQSNPYCNVDKLLIAIIVVLIVTRTIIRHRNSKKFSADDYWIMFAAVGVVRFLCVSPLISLFAVPYNPLLGMPSRHQQIW